MLAVAPLVRNVSNLMLQGRPSYRIARHLRLNRSWTEGIMPIA